MRRISTSITAAALAFGLVLSFNSVPAQAATPSRHRDGDETRSRRLDPFSHFRLCF